MSGHMERKGIIKAVVLTVMVLFISSMAWAEDAAVPAGTAQADNMQIVKDKIKADKKFLIAANMNLTDNEAKAFWPVYESYQKDLAALNERALKNVVNYADNADKMTDEMAKKVVKESLAIESDRQKLRQSYLPKFEKALPYKKVMRYYQLENKILAVINFEAARQIPLVE